MQRVHPYTGPPRLKKDPRKGSVRGGKKREGARGRERKWGGRRKRGGGGGRRRFKTAPDQHGIETPKPEARIPPDIPRKDPAEINAKDEGKQKKRDPYPSV